MAAYDDEDNYTPEIYQIPINVSDNGNVLGGFFKLRNLIECIVLSGFFGLAFKILTIPFPFTLKIAIFVFINVPIGIIALVGVDGESLIEFLSELFFFKKKKRVMTYRLPRKIKEEEEKKRWFSK